MGLQKKGKRSITAQKQTIILRDSNIIDFDNIQEGTLDYCNEQKYDLDHMGNYCWPFNTKTPGLGNFKKLMISPMLLEAKFKNPTTGEMNFSIVNRKAILTSVTVMSEGLIKIDKEINIQIPF